jgi:hypothetical protein
MNPSQNSLFKADTYVRPVAESGILGLVHSYSSSASPRVMANFNPLARLQGCLVAEGPFLGTCRLLERDSINVNGPSSVKG